MQNRQKKQYVGVCFDNMALYGMVLYGMVLYGILSAELTTIRAPSNCFFGDFSHWAVLTKSLSI